MKELFEIVDKRKRRPDLPYGLATVMSVQGSSYRRPGARMLVDAHERVAGSVSGGCLEKDVISRCQRALITQRAELVTYDTTDQDDWGMGTSLGCDGKIDILIEPLLPGASWPLGEVVESLRTGRESIPWVTFCRETTEEKASELKLNEPQSRPVTVLPPREITASGQGIKH